MKSDRDIYIYVYIYTTVCIFPFQIYKINLLKNNFLKWWFQKWSLYKEFLHNFNAFNSFIFCLQPMFIILTYYLFKSMHFIFKKCKINYPTIFFIKHSPRNSEKTFLLNRIKNLFASVCLGLFNGNYLTGGFCLFETTKGKWNFRLLIKMCSYRKCSSSYKVLQGSMLGPGLEV